MINPKNNTWLPALTVVAVLITSCGSGETENENEDPFAGRDVEVKSTFCTLTSFGEEGTPGSAKLVFDKGRISAATIISEDGEEDDVIYTIDDEGRVDGFTSTNNGAAILIYNDMNQLVQMEGKEGINHVGYVNNRRDQVTKQMTFVEGVPLMSKDFVYDDFNRVIEIQFFDNNNVVTERKSIEYDDKKNPFIGLGLLVNPYEMALGYSTANGPNNITKITTTFVTDSDYQVDGKTAMAGETSVQEFTMEYNEQGYPVTITDGNSSMELTYDCE